MLTIFSTPKPLKGHSDIIQRNAIRSWTLLHPDVEVILFGDEEGAAQVCGELGIRHQPRVRRTSRGTKYLASIFDRAQEIARHDVLCYANCDIMLTSDFRLAVERVAAAHQRFLIVGRRWDTNVTEPLDFGQKDWEVRLRQCALRANVQRPKIWIDYFVFSRGLYYQKIPPLVIGRPGWDPWLIWFASASRVPVVDASQVVVAVHQNHDYSYHPQGAKGVGGDEEAGRNYQILGSWWHHHTTDSATERLMPAGLQRHRLYWLAPIKQGIYRWMMNTWFKLLDVTRPIRHPLGLRRHGRPADGSATS
jgi:hypothetical protein